MAKRTAESESELQPIAKRVRFGDAGIPHRFTPACWEAEALKTRSTINVGKALPLPCSVVGAASSVEVQFLLRSLFGCLRNLTAVLPSLFYIATCTSSAISRFFPRRRMTVSR